MSPKDYFDEHAHNEKLAETIRLTIAIMTLAILLFMQATARANTITQVAASEIGRGETFSDNHGPDVRKYLRGSEGLPWCAGFVSYCAKQAGYATRYTLRAKDYLQIGKRVNKPQPGDIAVFNRNGGGHVGIVYQVTGNQIITIEGNSGNFPAKVKKITNTKQGMDRRGLIAYVRLEREEGVSKWVPYLPLVSVGIVDFQ